MAINDKENPEEGTPRSNKDIRKERRQMRAVNRDRKSMGAEPLYSKEEIKGVKKPFEPAPGTVVAGTPVVVDNTPDVEYIKAGYGSGKNEVKEVSQEFKAGTKEAEEIRKDSEAGQQLVKTLAAAPNSATTTENVIQTKVSGDNTLTSSQVDDMNKASLVVGNKVEEENKKINEEALNAKNTASNIGDLTQMPPGTPDDWVNTYVTEGFEPEDKDTIIDRAAAAAKKRAPQLAIEKLGVQDYYPEIGRDIAVGTFTGSRIGSQTIYSGAGGVLPLGLYDARKRAIAADIKKKEALMDQLKEMPDIAKQYKPAFAQSFYEGLMDYVDAYKDNPEGLASDPGYLKFMSTQKGVAENFSKTSAYLSDLEEKLVDPKTGSPAAWVTPGMLKIINNVKTGMVPGKVEDYFSGKKNIAKVLNTVRALPDALKQADDIIKQLMDKGGVETAINLKTGKAFNEKELEDLNNLVRQIKSPSADYEMFSELKKKYFDFEYDQIAKDWVDMHMFDQPKEVKEEVIANMSRYIESHMPDDAIISTITKQTNDAAERQNAQLDYQASMARINAENWRFQKEYEKHNSATRAQIEAMEQGGFNQTSLKSSEVKINPDNTGDKEYKVWFFTLDKKGNKNFKQDYVSAAEIKRNPNMYFKDNKAGSLFTVPATGYFGVNQNVVAKEGNNYNGQQYGTMFEVVGEDAEGRNIYEPSETQWRSRKTTLKQGGSYEVAAEQSYNTSMGQNPNWQAADTEGRGPSVKESAGGGSYVKTNKQ